AESARLEVLADDLIFALRVVDAESPAREHVLAVLRPEREIPHGRAEHHRLDLRAAILEREVEVTGVPVAAVRDLAFDPDLGKARFEKVADRCRQFRDRQHAPFRSRGRTQRLVVFFKGLREQIRHGYGPAVCTAVAASASTSAAERLSRSIATARPVAGSACTRTALSRAGPPAGSNLAGIPLRNRPSAA